MPNEIVTEMVHFTGTELSCNCGCGLVGLTQHFADKVEYAREKAGVAFVVRSSRRCDYWNTLQGGKGNSEHLWGDALDVEAKDSFTRWKIVKAAIDAGIRRIGIGATFVHLGDGLQYSPYPVIWNYAFAGAVAKEAEDLDGIDS